MRKRRVLHVPAMDLEPGDLVSLGGSSEKESEAFGYCQVVVTESRPSEDPYPEWYLQFEDSDWNQFCAPHKQFTLLLDLQGDDDG